MPPATRPDPPQRPTASPPPAAASGFGCLGLVLVALGLLVALGTLVVLSTGLLAYAALVGGLFFVYALFHYGVWGWWLADRIRRDVDSELRAAADPAGTASTTAPSGGHSAAEAGD
jgi:hypothetical protein